MKKHLFRNYLVLLLLITLSKGYSDCYYSQLGQDRYVNENFFEDMHGGVFVDIGAYDGVTGSNSLFFEKYRGWTGICVEPVPAFFERMETERSCTLVNAAIGRKGVQEFMWVKDVNEQLSGLIETYDPERKELVDKLSPAANGDQKIIKVETIPLMELLDKHQLTHIDYLSIDTEGGELEILQSIDFDLIHIDVIDVENNADDPNFAAYLATKGYKKVARIVVDDIYIKEQ